MRALIYGVTGQDGAYLARFLLDRGYEVWGASRDAAIANKANLKALGIEDGVRMISTTLTDFRSVLSSLAKVQPDEIYNLAGQSSVSLSFEEPVDTMHSISLGTLNLLECIRYAGNSIKFYSAGSGECFGDVGEAGATEITALRPRSPYGVAKAAAQWQVTNYRESYGLFACTGILFNHESPLRPRRFVTRKVISAVHAISRGSKEKLKLGNTSMHRDWGWAPEYVEAMWRMLQTNLPQDLVIATGESHTLKEFVASAFQAIGKEMADYVEQDDRLLRPSEILFSRGDPARASVAIGWKARYHMHDVIRMMLDAE